MAKFSNVFKEASRRFQDFKERGFIPTGSKYAFQDFVNQVAAENRGEEYRGAYTNDAYERAYGVPVEYYDDTTFADVVESREENLVEKFKDELRVIIDTSGEGNFFELAARWKVRLGFDVEILDTISTIDELLAFINKLKTAQVWVFRKKNGRNRREESSQLPSYLNIFENDLVELKHKIVAERTKFLE